MCNRHVLPQAKALLDSIRKRLEDGLFGVLDNINQPKVARTTCNLHV